MSTFHVEIMGEFVLEADSLEELLPILEANIANQGLVVYVDRLSCDCDDVGDDDEPIEPIEWNPFPVLVAGRN